MTNSLFKNLFILEMANNHMGSRQHGINIVRAFHDVTSRYPFQFAIKFQYRDLNTFIHSDFKGRTDIRYIKRFEETRLSMDDFLSIKTEAESLGFLSMCTPFDEVSVERIEAHNYPIIKIASCSFTDWPLLERIAATDKPIVASTAGAALEEIDRVVSFFTHRRKELCLMHCVGSYPTPDSQLEMNQIDFFKNRFENIAVGFSTHESPDNYNAIRVAIAKGARVFERHVGLPTDTISNNAYSSSPAQLDGWLTAARQTFDMCGIESGRRHISQKEADDLRGLKRGVFAREQIDAHAPLTAADVYYAIPCQPNQLLANDMSKYLELTSLTQLQPHEAIMNDHVKRHDRQEEVLSVITRLASLLKTSGIRLSNRLELELSHHYGLDKFLETGCAIITCFNREYCKKIISLLPGQRHPGHLHKKKEETFHMLFGEMEVTLGDEKRLLKEGDMITIERETNHSFASANGAVFEEVSTTHFKEDSFYDDPRISQNAERKTQMTFWADWLGNEFR